MTSYTAIRIAVKTDVRLLATELGDQDKPGENNRTLQLGNSALVQGARKNYKSVRPKSWIGVLLATL